MTPQMLLRCASCGLAVMAVAAQPDTWRSLMDEGYDLLARGRFSEARERYTLALRQAEPAGNPEALAASLTALGAVQHEFALFEEAERLHRRALAAVGPDHRLAPTILTNLASTLLQQNDSAQARQLFQQVYDYWKKTSGSHDTRSVIALSDIANTYEMEGQYERAAALYARALKHLERALGPDHRATLKTLTGYAATVAARNDHRRAERLWREVVSRHERTLGPKHPETVGAVLSLASLFVAQKKPDCVPAYERAISDGTETLGENHAVVIVAITGFSGCLSTLGQHTAGAAAARRTLHLCESAVCPPHVRAAALANLAFAVAGQSSYSEAAALYAEALSSCTNSQCGIAMVQKMLPAYAAVLRKVGRKDEAVPVEARAQAIADNIRARSSLIDVRDLQPTRP